MTDYERIASAIAFLNEHRLAQPNIDALAAHLHLSKAHMQRMFRDWAGISPKRFLQALTVAHAKQMLASGSTPLLDIASDLGLSSASRLHDHFVQLEAVTPAEYRRGGEGVELRWGIANSPYGHIALAYNARGIVTMSFLEGSEVDDPEIESSDGTQQETALQSWLKELAEAWPNTKLIQDDVGAGRFSERMFADANTGTARIALNVQGTNFQIAVWRALLRIPSGTVVSYSHVAASIDKPTATRAVASAIAANPIAFLIPCHRVIRQSGALGGYRWGVRRKQAMLVRESLLGSKGS